VLNTAAPPGGNPTLFLASTELYDPAMDLNPHAAHDRQLPDGNRLAKWKGHRHSQSVARGVFANL
jgi:hypothetical protein